MSKITKEQFDVAYKAITGHDGRMKDGYVHYFTCWQYWIDTCDPKLKGKDIAAWELAATNAGAPVSATLRRYARCGFILDSVPAAAKLAVKELEKFDKLIELSATNGFSWKDKGHTSAVAAFADSANGDVDAAKKEADRLQPVSRKSKETTAEQVKSDPVTVDIPTDPLECGKLIAQLVGRTTSPVNTLGFALRSLADSVDILTPAIAASNPPMIDSAMQTLSKDIAREFLLAAINRIGVEEVAEIFDAYTAPSAAPAVSIESIESQLQPA